MIREQVLDLVRFAALAALALAAGGCGFYDRSGRLDEGTGTVETSSSSSSSTSARSATPAGGTSFEVYPPPGTAAIPVPADGIHVVERGNTVFSISRLYKVPVRAIIDQNGLAPPYTLKIGDRIRLAQQRSHTVAKGETVYSISRRYGVQLNELTRSNRIAPPYTIGIGQVLTIPSGGGAAVAGVTPAGGGAGGTQVVVNIPKASGGGTAEVKELPPAVPAASPPPQPAAKASPRQLEALPKPPARASRTFLWPVRGKVIARFGAQSGGRHNDGINISARRGTTVVAAENGVVAYAGNELRGFGNLLLIKHADGYMTAYAHNEALLVGRGAKVTKGQPIARVGSTGSVGSPQLHFEIRQGRKAIDPMRHLPRQSASN